MNCKGNRTKITYFCRLCNNLIGLKSALYGSTLCRKCSQKERRKSNHYFCIDCDKRVSNKNTQRCQKCYGKDLHSHPEKTSKFNGGITLKSDYRNNYNKRRKIVDIKFRITSNLRGRLSHAIRGFTKSKTTLELIGCTVENLKTHLERQFKDDMSWENYGKWHVDHIKPCASFDLSKVEEQCKCFHYTNLQPLWAIENLRKNKY